MGDFFVQGSVAACHTWSLFQPKNITKLFAEFEVLWLWSVLVVSSYNQWANTYYNVIMVFILYQSSLQITYTSSISLSLLCVLTVWFYCFWFQVHCTYLSHQNKHALNILRTMHRPCWPKTQLVWVPVKLKSYLAVYILKAYYIGDKTVGTQFHHCNTAEKTGVWLINLQKHCLNIIITLKTYNSVILR